MIAIIKGFADAVGFGVNHLLQQPANRIGPFGGEGLCADQLLFLGQIAALVVGPDRLAAAIQHAGALAERVRGGAGVAAEDPGGVGVIIVSHVPPGGRAAIAAAAVELAGQTVQIIIAQVDLLLIRIHLSRQVAQCVIGIAPRLA